MVNPEREVECSYPPLGPAYLVSYIKHNLSKHKIDFQMIRGDFEHEIKKRKPDIIGISCVSQNYNAAKKLAFFCKQVGVKSILIGGSHISLCPLSLDQNIDIGIVGEGEETFLELMKVYLKRNSFPKDELKKINGVVYWDKNKLATTPRRNLINPIDKIPFPDRSLFKVDPNMAHIFSSRGCPYRCVFCSSSRFWNKVRFHSAEYVFKEIKELVRKYGAKRINFYDDLFIADKKRIRRLGCLLTKAGLNKKVEIYVSARANLIDDEICHLLKKINTKGISMGLESGSPKILKFLKGETITVDDNLRAVNTIKKHGLYCSGSFIIGSPMDTKDTILDTLNFIKKSKIDEFGVYALTPLPGTPVWEYAQKKKLIPSDYAKINWNNIDVNFNSSHKYNVHLAKSLTREELYSMYQLFKKEKNKRTILRGIRLLFTNPGRFFYHLKNIINGESTIKLN